MPVSALYTFLPLVVTVTINSLISLSLVSRERKEARAGCAGCRLQGGACEEHRDWLALSREKDQLDKLLQMRTVRMTVFTAFGFLLCQVIISAAWLEPDTISHLTLHSGSLLHTLADRLGEQQWERGGPGAQPCFG